VKRINLKFLLIFAAIVVVGAASIFFLRRYQVRRNAGNLASLAKQRLEEGKPAEAIMLYGRYIGLRPEDSAAFAEYAKLILARAEAPDATRSDLARAYNTLETAVRRNPDNDDLRRRLAEFQLRIGRPIDAREHLAVLKERLAAGDLKDAPASKDEPERKPLDAGVIDILTARSLLGSNDFEDAAKLVAAMVGFDMTTRQFSSDARASAPTEAYLMLGAILEEKLGDKQAASLVLDRLVRDQKQDVQAWLARSSWYRQHGNLDAAEADINEAIALAPENVNSIFAGFELALSRQDFDTARTLAEKGRELAPADERAYRGLAALALQRGDLAVAEQVLLDGVEQLPTKASLLLMLSDTLLQQNKLEEVAQSIARIKELYGPSSPAVGLLEGRLLVAQRKWADAKTKLEAVRPLVIGSPDLVRQVDLYLGQCHAQLDEFDAQLDVNRRVLSEDPSSLAARAGTAAALAAAGKPDEALTEFESIAAALPPDRLAAVPQVWYPLLQLRMQRQAKQPVPQRDWSSIDQLIDTLEQSAAMTPAQLALLRADVLIRKGEAESAREILEQAAKDHGGPQVWAALATLILRTAGPEAAAEVIGRMPADVAASAAILTVRGQVAAGRDAEARAKDLAELEKQGAALTSDEEAANVLSSLASVHIATGDLATAERLWRDVVKRQPDNIKAREAVLELVLNQGNPEKAKEAAAEVSAAAGASSARARVADASVKIFEVRVSQKKRKEAGDADAALTPEEQKAVEEARNLLIEAENDRPGWAQIQTLFADVDTLRGDTASAIERLKKAVTLGPANPSVTRRLVGQLYTANRLEEAQAALATLGAEGETGSDRLTAERQIQEGKVEEAVALADRSVPKDSRNPDDLLWLGQILERCGKRDRAGEVLLRAVEVAPERSDVQLALFAYQASAGNKQAAERTLDRAAELMKEPQKQLARAQGLEMLGRIEDAEAAFREAVKVATDDLDTHRALASFLVRSGRLGPAQESLQVILGSTDDSKQAVATKAWARRLSAELIAEKGSFREMQRAMELLKLNVDDKGEVALDDALLQVKLLTSRPEPASWKQAIAILEELARRQPLVMGQRIMLAQLREKVGRWDECRNELIAVTAAPNVPPAYVAMLVEKMIDHGEVTTARQWLSRVQKANPDSAITIALEAKLAIAENDRKLAADAARKLMPGGVVSGSEPGQLSAVAKLMEQLGFPKAADKVFTQFAELLPEGAAARAEFLGRQKRPQEALDLLEARWNDLSLERLLGVAVQVVRVQDNPKEWTARIEPWFVKAKRIDPGSVVIQLLEAELFSLDDQPAEAEKIYRDLLNRPDIEGMQKAIVSNNLAFHLAKPDTAAEAKKLIDAAIDELGPLPDLLDTRGMIHMAAGESRQAVGDFAEAVLQPTDVKFLHLAWANLEAGDKAAAKEALEAGRRRGLAKSRLSPEDRERLSKLEETFGAQDDAQKNPEG
jgi:cellulose synthase operon protein C